MLGNWLAEENLLSFLIILSRQVSYDFGPDNWKAIQFGIHASSIENNSWYSHILPGTADINLQLAREDGTGLIGFRVNIPDDLERNFEFMVGILQEFKVTPSSYDPSRV